MNDSLSKDVNDLSCNYFQQNSIRDETRRLSRLFFCPKMWNLPCTGSLFNHNSIETLIGSNYTKWREDVEIALGLLDYEMAIEEEPDADASAGAKAKYAKWVKANKMAILIMRMSISPSVRGSITSSDNAKKFIDSIGEKFRESEKAEIGTLMG
ncbi:unnamed protein product [Prunus armeniaca]